MQWERISEEENSSVFKEHIERYKFASKYSKNKKVLDAACGTGYGSDLLTKSAKEVTGIDISQKTIDFCKKKYLSPNFLQMNATKIKFKNESVDLIVSFETIEHLKEYENMLSEFVRVLKKQGKLIISTPNKKIRKNFFTEIPNNPFHIQEFTKKEFRKLLQKYFKKITFYGQIETRENKNKTIKILIDGLITLDIFKIRKYFLSFIGNKTRNYLMKINTDDFSVKKYDATKNYSFLIAVCTK
jgi:ubiquinone/menaquinone biosynthesis C-methylase UbiE